MKKKEAVNLGCDEKGAIVTVTNSIPPKPIQIEEPIPEKNTHEELINALSAIINLLKDIKNNTFKGF